MVEQVVQMYITDLDSIERGITSRERPKSAPNLRLKIEKGGPFGLCETPAGCKKWKKMKGGPFGDMKKFPK